MFLIEKLPRDTGESVEETLGEPLILPTIIHVQENKKLMTNWKT